MEQWKVYKRIINSETYYLVGRLIEPHKPELPGNIEFAKVKYPDGKSIFMADSFSKDAAEQLAARFNKQSQAIREANNKLSDAILNALDNQVEFTVHNYITDWYEHDRPRVSNCNQHDKFIVMLYKNGIDTVFLNGEMVSFSNMKWGKDCIESKRLLRYIYYDGNTLTEIPHNIAYTLFKKEFAALPKEYIEAATTAFDNHKELFLKEWNAQHNFKEGIKTPEAVRNN